MLMLPLITIDCEHVIDCKCKKKNMRELRVCNKPRNWKATRVNMLISTLTKPRYWARLLL